MDLLYFLAHTLPKIRTSDTLELKMVLVNLFLAHEFFFFPVPCKRA